MVFVQQMRESAVGKESACKAGDPRSIPGLRIYPGEEKGYPLQYSGLENSTDCIIHGVAKSWTRLNDFHFTQLFKKIIYLFIWLHWVACRILVPQPGMEHTNRNENADS